MHYWGSLQRPFRATFLDNWRPDNRKRLTKQEEIVLDHLNDIAHQQHDLDYICYYIAKKTAMSEEEVLDKLEDLKHKKYIKQTYIPIWRR